MISQAVKKFVADNAGILTDIEIASQLTMMTGVVMTWKSVIHIRQKLEIEKPRGARGNCRIVKRSEDEPEGVV